jgi:hypothetical protein
MKNKILLGLAAIAAAQTAEANVYLPGEFAALQDSMNAVNAKIAEVDGKLFKNYKTVIADLAKVKTDAETVTANVAVKKDEVKKEAEGLLNNIKAVVAENAKLLPKLPRGKEGAAVIEQIKGDLNAVDATVAEAQSLFDKGTYMDALNKIKAASDKANSLNAEIKEVLTKARIKF